MAKIKRRRRVAKITGWASLLSVSYQGYKKNPFILIPALIPILFSIFLNAIENLGVYAFFVFMVISFLIGIYVKAGMLGIVKGSWRRKSSLKEFWKTANKKFFNLLGAETVVITIVGLIILGAWTFAPLSSLLTLFYGIGFAVAVLFLSFTSYAIILSDLKALDGIKESVRFVRKNFFRVILFFIIVFLLILPVIATVSALKVSAPLIGNVSSSFLRSVIMWVVSPYFLFLQAYFYLAKK